MRPRHGASSTTSGKSAKANRSPGMGPHILVVGGTGMLSGLVEALAGDGGRLSLFSRHASRLVREGVAGYDVDYHDETAFTAALDAAGPVDLAVAWFHTLKIPGPRRL